MLTFYLDEFMPLAFWVYGQKFSRNSDFLKISQKPKKIPGTLKYPEFEYQLLKGTVKTLLV